MKYTLLVLLTEDNDNFRTQLEERISDLECIEEITTASLMEEGIRFWEEGHPTSITVPFQATGGVESYGCV